MQPVTMLHVSFRLIFTFFAWADLHHTGQAYSSSSAIGSFCFAALRKTLCFGAAIQLY